MFTVSNEPKIKMKSSLKMFINPYTIFCLCVCSKCINAKRSMVFVFLVERAQIRAYTLTFIV